MNSEARRRPDWTRHQFVRECVRYPFRNKLWICWYKTIEPLYKISWLYRILNRCTQLFLTQKSNKGNHIERPSPPVRLETKTKKKNKELLDLRQRTIVSARKLQRTHDVYMEHIAVHALSIDVQTVKHSIQSFLFHSVKLIGSFHCCFFQVWPKVCHARLFRFHFRIIDFKLGGERSCGGETYIHRVSTSILKGSHKK